jgi:hypothetical protein
MWSFIFSWLLNDILIADVGSHLAKSYLLAKDPSSCTWIDKLESAAQDAFHPPTGLSKYHLYDPILSLCFLFAVFNPCILSYKKTDLLLHTIFQFSQKHVQSLKPKLILLLVRWKGEHRKLLAHGLVMCRLYSSFSCKTIYISFVYYFNFSFLLVTSYIATMQLINWELPKAFLLSWAEIWPSRKQGVVPISHQLPQ